MPKISNFLWSRDFFGGKNSVYPIIILPSGEEVWKRWYDPDRLYGKRFEPLFWEIIWCIPKNLPFKDIPIKNLYSHLLNLNYEMLPELPDEYRNWRRNVATPRGRSL